MRADERCPDQTSVDPDLSAMRPQGHRDHAYRRLSVFLRLPRLWRGAEAQAGRLLRLLLLRRRSVPTDSEKLQRVLRVSTTARLTSI